MTSEKQITLDLPGPWTSVYGLARTLLAGGTLLTLLAHNADTLFRPLGSTAAGLGPYWLEHTSMFWLLPDAHLEIARWIAILVLAVVASGFAPRLTGIPHWWISYSFMQSSVVLEGGDQITAVLTLLLIPVTLTDPRRWHWSAPVSLVTTRQKLAGLAARSAWIVIRLQVAIVYLHAAVGKLQVREWVDGTALYYWFLDPSFGAAAWLRPAVEPIVTTPLVTIATWGALVLEFALFLGLLAGRRARLILLSLGLLFHAGIVVVHGLVAFFLAMAAALVLYLVPAEARLDPMARWERLREGALAMREGVGGAPSGARPPRGLAVGDTALSEGQEPQEAST